MSGHKSAGSGPIPVATSCSNWSSLRVAGAASDAGGDDGSGVDASSCLAGVPAGVASEGVAVGLGWRERITLTEESDGRWVGMAASLCSSNCVSSGSDGGRAGISRGMTGRLAGASLFLCTGQTSCNGSDASGREAESASIGPPASVACGPATTPGELPASDSTPSALCFRVPPVAARGGPGEAEEDAGDESVSRFVWRTGTGSGGEADAPVDAVVGPEAGGGSWAGGGVAAVT